MSLIRYAGIWSVTQYYALNMMVVSPIDSQAYVLQITNLTGGSDPSVVSPNWLLIPSGSGVVSLNGLDGILQLLPGTNITITPSGQDITIGTTNRPLVNRTSTTTTTPITATTFGTAQTLLTLVIAPTFVSDINISSVMTFAMVDNTIHDLSFFITVNGTPVGGTFKISGSGTGHFINPSCQATAFNQSIGNHTIAIKAFADTSTVFYTNLIQLAAIANLV